MQLRDYQRNAIDRLRAVVMSGRRRVCLVMPTGTGKSLTGSAIIHNHLARRATNSCVVYVHRQELAHQFAGTLERIGVPSRTIIAGQTHGDRNARVTVAMVQSVDANPDMAPQGSMVLFDECFPKGTMVQTADGSKPIELVSVGDLVWSSDGRSVRLNRVDGVMSKASSAIVALRTSSGREIVCTEEHPVWNGIKYIPAKDMINEEASVINMRMVRDAIRCNTQKISVSKERTPNVLYRLRKRKGKAHLFRNDVENQQATSIGKDEREKPNDVGHHARQSFCKTKGNRPQTNGQKGQRSWTTSPSVDAGRSVRGRVEDGANGINRNKEKWLAVKVQRRHCKRSRNDSHRGGWSKSWRAIEKDLGRKKDRVFTVERVVSVSSVERGSHQTVVYNLSVERDHTYFANGILVHNCHHIAAKTWRSIAARYDQSVVLGLTATPERADGKGLGDVFNALEVILSTEEAVEQGYLVPCRVYAPSEYTPKLSADPTEVYLTKCPGQKTLVFATNCTQSRELVDTISKHGFRAAHIDGKTSDSERKRIIRSFASGETRVLSSVGVLTEGFDDPSAEVAIIARGADHAGTWLQIVGRVLRLSPGKSRADVYDLRGIVHKHGLPTDPRTFSLEGKPITHDSDRLATARCKLCGAVTRASITKCPVCGHERPPPKAPEIIRQQIKAYVARETVDQRSAYREKLESIARARGYKRGWVEHRLRAKYEPNDIQDRA